MPDPSPRTPRGTRAALALLLAVLVVVGPHPGAAAPRPGGPDLARQADDGPQLPDDPDADPDRVRRTADEILAQDRYQAPEQQGETVLDRLSEWLRDRLPEISGPGQGATDGLSVLIVGAVVAASAALVAWVVVASRRSRRAPDDDEVDSDIELTPLRTADEWEAEAERCEEAGDHRGAVRARFRAVTRQLVDRDLVADSPGRTAGELRADLEARAPEAAPSFAPLAELFERAWFGPDGAGPDDSAAARRMARAATDAAPRHPTRTDPAEVEAVRS